MNPNIQNGIDWLAKNFYVHQNFGGGQQWRFYYLYGLERAGRLAGVRFLGEHDWFSASMSNGADSSSPMRAATAPNSTADSGR